MIAGGIWSCRWRELRPIGFGTGSAGTSSSGKANGAVTGGKSNSGGGGGGGVGGEYEMVGTGILDAEDGRLREGRG